MKFAFRDLWFCTISSLTNIKFVSWSDIIGRFNFGNFNKARMTLTSSNVNVPGWYSNAVWTSLSIYRNASVTDAQVTLTLWDVTGVLLLVIIQLSLPVKSTAYNGTFACEFENDLPHTLAKLGGTNTVTVKIFYGDTL